MMAWLSGWNATASGPSADKVSPGVLGAMVTLALALATLLLIRSMVGHLRKVRYSPGPVEEQEPGARQAEAGGDAGEASAPAPVAQGGSSPGGGNPGSSNPGGSGGNNPGGNNPRGPA